MKQDKECAQDHKLAEQAQPALRQAAAGDALLLARLHGQEVDAALLKELRSAPFADLFALLPESEAARQACEVIDAGWQALETDDEQALLDELAADYTALYITYRHRVSPDESVWLDEDELVRQQPMMEVRQWYRRFGVAARDWRKMADDHLAVQLAFIAHMLTCTDESGMPHAHWRDMAAFMDEHLLLWIGDFASAAASRCDTPCYAALAMFTHEWLMAFRRLLERLGGGAMPNHAELREKRRRKKTQDALQQAFMPGMGPAV